MDCKTMKKSWWRRKLSFLGRLLGFKKRSTGGNSSTRNDDVAKSSMAAGQPVVGAVENRTSTQEKLKSTQAREHGRAGTLSRMDDRREVSNAVGPASRKKTKTDRNTKKCSVDSAAIDTKMDRPVDNNHTTIVQTRERVPSEAKSAVSQNERPKSNSMTGNDSCQRLKIKKYSAEYVARLAPVEDHTPSVVNSDLRPGNKNGAGLTASNERREDSPVNVHSLTVTKTLKKVPNGCMSVNKKTGRCQSDINEIKSYQEDLPERSLYFQRSKTGVESKAVKNVSSKTMTKIAQRCVEYAAHLSSTDRNTPSILNSDLRSDNKNDASMTARNVRIGDDPVNNYDSIVTKTQKMIQSGFKSVNVQMSRCKSDKTEIKSCQEGKQTHSINCKWSQIAIDMEPVKYYAGPKTTTPNTAITAQNCSEGPSGLTPTDAGTPSIVNTRLNLRPGNENGSGLPVGGTRRKDGPVNKNNIPVTVKARERVRSVTVKAPTSTKVQKPEVNKGWRRKDVPEKTTKSQQPKTGIDSKAVKCNDLSNTIKTRTTANARIRPAVAARAAPADRIVPPRIANGNNPRPGNKNGASLPAGGARTGGGPVNKNGLPVTVKAREIVRSVTVKAPTSTKTQKPVVNRGWRREGLPEKTAKSQKLKTVIDSKAVKCNTRPKAVKSDARAAVMDDNEPIDRDQRRYTTVDDADFTTIDRWADVLIEEDLMMLEEPQIPIFDEFW